MIENDFSNFVYTTMQIITSPFFRVWTWTSGDKTSVWWHWQDQGGGFIINVKEAKNKEEPDTCDLETGFHSDILKKQFASLRSLWKLIFKAHFNWLISLHHDKQLLLKQLYKNFSVKSINNRLILYGCTFYLHFWRPWWHRVWTSRYTRSRPRGVSGHPAGS